MLPKENGVHQPDRHWVRSEVQHCGNRRESFQQQPVRKILSRLRTTQKVVP